MDLFHQCLRLLWALPLSSGLCAARQWSAMWWATLAARSGTKMIATVQIWLDVIFDTRTRELRSSCDQPNKGVYLWKAAWKWPGGQCDFLEFGWIYSLDLHFPWAFGTIFLAQPKHHQIESNQLKMQANAVIFAVIQVFKVNAKQSSASLLNFSWGLCWWLCWLVSLQCLLPPSWSKDLLKPSRTSKPEKIH